ncbi:MAG: hypothetical protein CVV21_04375 [Candidatus Goldiibacteriota bacterium HGW-Goldbacteria-1]|jgi:cytochrome c oxidase subunit IV|nr:MAG: hypothetical protein CVV21_04375 [Candidatus Goldiibacteriota bacterium HGW-Goldbacteria-1]
MAKNKNKENRKAAVSDDTKYTMKDYLVINAMFWAFLIVLSIVVFISTGAKWDGVMSSVFTFIFLVFGMGFTIVSMFDFVYDRLADKNEAK